MRCVRAWGCFFLCLRLRTTRVRHCVCVCVLWSVLAWGRKSGCIVDVLLFGQGNGEETSGRRTKKKQRETKNERTRTEEGGVGASRDGLVHVFGGWSTRAEQSRVSKSGSVTLHNRVNKVSFFCMNTFIFGCVLVRFFLVFAVPPKPRGDPCSQKRKVRKKKKKIWANREEIHTDIQTIQTRQADEGLYHTQPAAAATFQKGKKDDASYHSSSPPQFTPCAKRRGKKKKKTIGRERPLDGRIDRWSGVGG